MMALRRLQPVNTIVLLGICAYFAMPLWWLAVSATKTQGELVTDAGLWSFSSHLVENLARLFSRNDGQFLRWLFNSVLYAGIGALIGTLLSAAVGYAISKYEFPGRTALFNTILAGVLVPPATLALPLPSLISPLGVYLARVSVDASVPNELIEAASIDGASGLRIFAVIALPLMGPGLVTIFLFQFVGIWNNFLLPLVMLNDSTLYPVTLGLYNWSGGYIQDPTLATSVLVGSLVATLPVIVAFVMLQRFWNTGLSQGAVKG